MAGLLRITVPACPPEPLLGNLDLVGGCIALALECVRDRMAPRRDHLADRYRLPPDPSALPDAGPEWRKREKLRFETYRHEEYLRLSSAIAELDDAIRRGEDVELVARLFEYGANEIERWSGFPILHRQFAWAECRACGRRYEAAECGGSDWSRVADPRAGIGGACLTCPAGHVIFSRQTWVA